MLVIEDADFENAVQKLRSAGFRASTWSYACREPELYEGRMLQNIYRNLTTQYSNLDQHSARFLFPLDQSPSERGPSESSTDKVVLLPSSYAHISVQSTLDGRFTRDGNMFYPNGAVLLESFVRVLVREPFGGHWTSNLTMWAITYLYGDLMLDDDILDSCDDEAAKAWFNKGIRRFAGGIDRITITKRLGRVGFDERLAKRDLS